MRAFYLLSLLACTSFVKAFAVPEAQLEKAWKEEIIPYIDSKAKSLELEVKKNITIKGMHIPSTGKKAIVFLPGRSESMMKYRELYYDLRNTGHHIFTLDHRGQGQSSRELSDPQKGHINTYDDYIADLRKFLKAFVLNQSWDRLTLVAHSMGGHIGLRYQAKYKSFDSMVLSSPMINFNSDPYPEAIARILVAAFNATGKGTEFTIDEGPYEPFPDFSKNKVTSSEIRFDLYHNWLSENPSLSVGGPTHRWVHKSYLSINKLMRKLRKIHIPVVIVQAGNELVAKKKDSKRACRKLKSCRYVEVPGAKHEIFYEADAFRTYGLEILKAYLK